MEVDKSGRQIGIPVKQKTKKKTCIPLIQEQRKYSLFFSNGNMTQIKDFKLRKPYSKNFQEELMDNAYNKNLKCWRNNLGLLQVGPKKKNYY